VYGSRSWGGVNHKENRACRESRNQSLDLCSLRINLRTPGKMIRTAPIKAQELERGQANSREGLELRPQASPGTEETASRKYEG
jgi:hypothetical protein